MNTSIRKRNFLTRLTADTFSAEHKPLERDVARSETVKNVAEKKRIYFAAGMLVLPMSRYSFHSPFRFCQTTTYLPLSKREFLESFIS